MKKELRKFVGLIRNEAGVAAVEFALIAPMLLLLLAGVADFGMFLNTNMKLQELSHRAAEYVVQGGLATDVTANILQNDSLYYVTDANQSSIKYTGATACECSNGAYVDCAGTCTGNDYVRSYFSATLTAVYTPIMPWPGITSGITLTGYSRLQYSQ